ncbi:malonyl CoA-ACP transacylase [Piscirickettsia salmonis]|uniref:Malonyl CoA-acyl carrier protein transacylase n=1 Tax=Piscirickettsia salmonis TaxID=1238 RepID=A0A9Q6Q138_PISSA|nr:ACP S-malonyltransferase [Piscirickettsia salmonis]ALA24139.1 malonyl CoA-ACP transacylase [Piscirickettsia salmonis]APS44536.1 malonyl CoA-ACP transacylase [Piscirickettsia salmonis]APS47897.1 malonyl CoA-ACP transacylase [Piscirickettsia salmonis]APS51854.1 malonyl CoA-ACP transacylase [Piscirickettsia salmonis]APS55073.1 malonyl CoA-ACP transacylase [Piscirickettsia salmonis]
MSQLSAFIFPGQGSQHVGMLSEINDETGLIHETFAEASRVLGYDLWELTQETPAERLNQTEYTQPALLTASIALWRLWQQSAGAQPSFLAGHSLGEYSALVAAESIDFKDAVKLVAARGRFMQEAVPVGAGAMAALIGLDDDKVVEICQIAAEKSGIVEAANFNSTGQVVIAGEVAAVDYTIELAKKAGARKALKLAMSVPSHCHLMKSAAEKLAVELKDIAVMSPKIPVIHNVDVASYSAPEQIRDVLVRQLYNPVRWVETVKKLEENQVRHCFECGPGKVLAGLGKRIAKQVQCVPLSGENGIAMAIEAMGS